jgi:hypothetical protein
MSQTITHQSVSFAGTVTSIGGLSLIIIGQCISLIAVVYLGRQFFSAATGIIEYIPKMIKDFADGKPANNQDNSVKKPASEVVSEFFSVTFVMCFMLAIGMGIKILGNFMQGEMVTGFFVRMTT